MISNIRESRVPDVVRHFLEAICGQTIGSHLAWRPKCAGSYVSCAGILLDFYFMNRAMQQVPGLFRLRIKKSVNKVQIYEKIPEMF